MNTDQKYEQFVATTLKSGEALVQQMTPEKASLNHMLVGLLGEVGELADAIKRFTMYDKQLDHVNVVEELGDIEWYLCGLRLELRKLGIYTDTEMLREVNMIKLRRRYPDAYSDEAAITRADKLETPQTATGE